jgi:metallophosphoesterase (TIGR00282 family)
MFKKISVLFLGDVVGTPGQNAVKQYMPILKEKYKPDFIFLNGENADEGKGITKKEADPIFELGVSVITTGNHIWDNWYSKPLLVQNPNVLRPFNYPAGNVGRGYAVHKLEDGTEICVINLQGRTFMQSIDCPFKGADYILKNLPPSVKIILVDFHADATAEKQALGWHLDGKISAIFGTHTHVPTADACILPKGTAYITDVGMTGPFNSVVGMEKETAIKRFVLQIPHKYEQADGDVRVCGANVILDADSGRALKIESFMIPEPRREEIDI